MKILVLLALAFCLMITTSRAADLELSAPAQSAYETLHQTEIYAVGPVGFAATTSESQIALRTLAADKNALPAFVALLDDESTSKVGRLYALLGLKPLDAAQFEARLPAFLDDESTVTEMSGCLMMPVKVKEIARKIAGRETTQKA